MEIQKFKSEFVFNTHRQEMYANFEEYLEYLKSIFEFVTIIVFGSFITEKEQPNDIDILVFGNPNKKGWNEIDERLKINRGLSLDTKEFINTKFEIILSPIDADCMINQFNNQENNKQKGIEIKNYIEIELNTNL